MKTKFNPVSSIALAVALVLAMSLPAIATGVVLPSATGDVGFNMDHQSARAVFDVRATGAPMPGEDHAPATGYFKFKTNGLSYVANITHIHAHSATEVHFGGMIVSASNSKFVGKFVHVSAFDGPNRGSGSDKISVVVSETDVHEHGTLVPVNSGNLTVRTQ